MRMLVCAHYYFPYHCVTHLTEVTKGREVYSVSRLQEGSLGQCHLQQRRGGQQRPYPGGSGSKELDLTGCVHPLLAMPQRVHSPTSWGVGAEGISHLHHNSKQVC